MNTDQNRCSFSEPTGRPEALPSCFHPRPAIRVHLGSSVVLSALLMLGSAVGFTAAAADSAKAAKLANTVFLDAIGVKNLRLQTVEAEEQTFEETVFALGRLRVAPGHRAIVSSRIAGRALSVSAHIDMRIEKGSDIAEIESRLPGDPPARVKLTAPIGGLISAIKLVPGQPVSPDSSLVEIVDLSEMHAVAAVPEHLVGKLKVGAKARLRVSAFPDREFIAELAHLGAEADSASGTLEAAFHVENPDFSLRPGMRAEFNIIAGSREGVISVPRAALQGEPANRFLYVADDGITNAFVKVPVEVGAMNDQHAEITKGLFPGDKVVTDGAYSLGFAGKGSVSLKEALDAAHGHEHNADGSELSKGAKSAGHAEGDGHDHGGSGGGTLSALTLFSLIGNGVLLVLLVVATLRRSSATQEPSAAPTEKPTTGGSSHAG